MATPRIVPLVGVPRQQGVQIPFLVAAAEWVDAIILTQNVAESYTLPTDADGNKAAYIRLGISTGAIFLNFNGTAGTPPDTNDGTASIRVPPSDNRRIFTVPAGVQSVSFFTASASGVISIEVWS